MPTIKGKWRWKPTIDCINYAMYTDIAFVSNNERFVGISTSAGLAYAVAVNDLKTVSYNDEYTLSSVMPQYREMDFGETEIEVSERFYNFLVENTAEGTTYIADITSLTAIKHRTDGEAEISTQVDKNGLVYTHITTNEDATVTKLTATNVPVGKIMFLKYRLNNGYYPNWFLGVTVRYTIGNRTVVAVGTPYGGVTNYELAKRHRGWAVGRVNAQGALQREGLWISDDKVVMADSIEIEIAHKDDLDVAYFMTDNYDANLMPFVKQYGDDYYMHQNILFGGYIDNQWRKIKDTLDGGTKVNDPFMPPSMPEHPDEPVAVYHFITFDFDGNISQYSVREGKRLSRPEDPKVSPLLLFDGWYIDKEYTQKYDFESDIYSEFILYARAIAYPIVAKFEQMLNNQQKVYNTGLERGYETGYDEGNSDGRKSGYEEGREEGFGEGREEGYHEGYSVGIEEGKQSEYDLFWDTFQKNGTRRYYENAFADTVNSGRMWVYNKTYKPKYKMKPLAAQCMYQYGYLPNKAIAEVDFSECTNFYQAFAYFAISDADRRFPPIDIRKATKADHLFGWCSGIRYIDKVYVSETTPLYTAFYTMNNLLEIRFDGIIAATGISFEKAVNLSRASIIDVIDHLSNTVTGKTATFSKTAVDAAFTTEEWETLIDTKPNWGFAVK